MKKTRGEIVGYRSDRCKWTAEAIEQALEARFPGKTKIDVGALIQAWLDDESLSKETIFQCANLAWHVTGIKSPGMARSPFTSPRKYLEHALEQL